MGSGFTGLPGHEDEEEAITINAILTLTGDDLDIIILYSSKCLGRPL